MFSLSSADGSGAGSSSAKALLAGWAANDFLSDLNWKRWHGKLMVTARGLGVARFFTTDALSVAALVRERAALYEASGERKHIVVPAAASSSSDVKAAEAAADAEAKLQAAAATYDRLEATAISLLSATTSAELSPIIASCERPWEAYQRLVTRCKPAPDALWQEHVRVQLLAPVMKQGENIDAFANRLRDLFDMYELAFGVAQADGSKKLIFLNGLPNSAEWTAAKRTWQYISSLGFDQVCDLASREAAMQKMQALSLASRESASSSSSSTGELAAMTVKLHAAEVAMKAMEAKFDQLQQSSLRSQGRGGRGRGGRQRGGGGSRGDGQGPHQQDIICWACKQVGHRQAECDRLKKMREQAASEAASLAAFTGDGEQAGGAGMVAREIDKNNISDEESDEEAWTPHQAPPADAPAHRGELKGQQQHHHHDGGGVLSWLARLLKRSTLTLLLVISCFLLGVPATAAMIRAPAIDRHASAVARTEFCMAAAVAAPSEPLDFAREPWLLDSGASRHLTGSRSLLRNIRELREPVAIKVADGRTLVAREEGEVSFSTPSGARTLKHVAHLPGLSANLVSVGALTKRGARFSFTADKAIAMKRNRVLLSAACSGKNLYWLQAAALLPRSQEAIAAPAAGESAFITADQLQLWHRRLGHVNVPALKHMHDSALVRGLASRAHEGGCTACARAKAHRAPFTAHMDRIQARAPFERVHADLMGPFSVESFSGARYVLTIVDEYTDAVWQYRLKQKSDTAARLEEWHRMVVTQHQARLIELHSDHGGEFTSKRLLEYWAKHGIIATTTPRDTPQHNAIAERKNRTLQEAMRSMLEHAQLPARFWALAMEAVVYIHNRSVRSPRRPRTPYEMLYRVAPSLRHARVFGCDAIVHDKNASGHIQARGRPMVFVGYESLRGAYKFYDPVRRCFLVERDAHFNESSFTTGRSGDTGRALLRAEVPPSVPSSDHLPLEVIDPIDDVRGRTGPLSQLPVPPSAADQRPLSPASAQSRIQQQLPQMRAYDSVNEWEESEDESERNQPAPPAVPARAPDQPVAAPQSLRPQRQSSQLSRALSQLLVQERAVAATAVGEPGSYREAMSSKEAAQWRAAMEEEMRSQAGCRSWETVQRSAVPNGKRILPCKWVYKLKLATDGSIARYKARVVAKGFMQRHGVDYFETYAPVMAYKTLRVLLSLAAIFNYEIKQFDITTAFLHAPIEEELYMELPEGFGQPGMVARLRRAVYGIKQAPRAWNDELHSFLTSLGFKRLRTDQCVYIRGQLILGLFVDDVIAIYPSDTEHAAEWEETRCAIFRRFTAKDLGDAHVILGMRITRDRQRRQLFLDQRAYIDKVVSQFGEELSGGRSVATPMHERPAAADRPTNATERAAMTEHPFHQLIGSLLYASISTRPDISFAVSALAQHSADPGSAHWAQALRVLRYLSLTSALALRLGGESAVVNVYTDADWAGDKKDAKSMSGAVTLIGDGPVQWSAKKQTQVSLSSMESEYYAMAGGVQDALWLHSLLCELRHAQSTSATLHVDNESAIAYCKTGGDQQRTRHFNVKYHFVRDHIKQQTIALRWIDGKSQLADIFTKPLDRGDFERHRARLLNSTGAPAR